MAFYRMNVTVIDGLRPFAVAAFNIPLILGLTEDPEAVKDTLKAYSGNDLAAVAADFPTTTKEYKAAQTMLAQDPHPDLFYIYSKTRSATPASTDLSDALNEAELAVEEGHLTPWYFVICTEHEQVTGDTEELGDAVSARTNMLIASNKAGETASSIITLAKAINSDRVVMMAHTAPDDERLDAGMGGYFAAMEVGSLTLDTKELNTVAAADWTSADMAGFLAVKGVNGACIPYTYQAGRAVTVGSWTTKGDYADIRRCKDWLVARLEEALFHLKLNNPKIPQTDHGRHQIESALRGVLNLAASKGILQQRAGVGYWEIDVPTLDWLSKNDPTALTQRHLRTIRMRVWPEGAWEAFTIIAYLNWEAAG